MAVREYYYTLLGRVAELQTEIGGIADALAKGMQLHEKTGAPSQEYLDKLKDALNTHAKHANQLKDAIAKIETDAGC